MRSVRSSCRVIARRSCISTWMVTRRKSPILRIGIRSTRGLPDSVAAPLLQGLAGAFQGERECVGKGRLGGYRIQFNSKMDDGSGDLRADAAENTFGAHQAGRGDCLQ